MGANKKIIATIGLFTLTLLGGCSQDNKHAHQLSYQHNLAPLTATTQSNLPVTINMEHTKFQKNI